MNPAVSEGMIFVSDSDHLEGVTSYQPETADLQLLAEIGLSAAVKGSMELSKPIFDALSLWLPGHPVAKVGVALAHLSEGEVDQAIALLKPAYLQDPSVSEVAAVLLIALALAERWDEARSIKKALLNGPDGPSKSIASRLASVVDG